MGTEAAAEEKTSEEEGGDEAVCAICFEPQAFVTLPCACRLNYCHACWDRAQSASVALRGHAQCPSCRVALKVDFDSVSGRLTFLPADGPVNYDLQGQLYSKIRPVQIRLLREFTATAHMEDASGRAGGRTNKDITICEVDAIDADNGQDEEPATSSPSATPRKPQAFPSCVCGARLEHLNSKARITRMLEETDSNWRHHISEPIESFMSRLAHGSWVSCDICQSDITNAAAIWTCQNGSRTILHPAAYDVCEQCFTEYAGADAAALFPVDSSWDSSFCATRETNTASCLKAGCRALLQCFRSLRSNGNAASTTTPVRDIQPEVMASETSSGSAM